MTTTHPAPTGGNPFVRVWKSGTHTRFLILTKDLFDFLFPQGIPLPWLALPVPHPADPDQPVDTELLNDFVESFVWEIEYVQA